ncbi:N6-adenosine-methyltransferase subunit METTL3 [Brachionus plicatilis]|uniref:N6-adenosine-methyltransferase subunit METTL3 n=1 Tax=Brachionus plicatilis TaxID=10195 RepID=A0A3M7RW87_BRAPC|nr:N6-adenosine-methyltransferase subunit METTL3 [Brachionus plicatilis]
MTTVEKLELEHFKSAKSHVQEYCPNGTKIDCCRDLIERGMLQKKCDKIHFKRIIKPHTDCNHFEK